MMALEQGDTMVDEVHQDDNNDGCPPLFTLSNEFHKHGIDTGDS